ncbi:MAG: glycerate kinase [Chloroflexi bacterium]|nr:MAG: glycerate kinase [Chloroflexota bacterium]
MIEFRSPTREHGKTEPHLGTVLSIMGAALEAVDPAEAIRRHAHRDGAILHVNGHTYNLDDYKNVYVIGAGKAGAVMAQAIEEILGDRLSRGTIVVKRGYTAPTRRIIIHEGGHPLPDPAGLVGTRRIAELLTNATDRDLVISLISGGGSALLVMPVDGIQLRDLQALTGQLLASGATINEINAVRKHLSAVKGGQLARMAAPAEVLTLILSDVVGSPLDVIASGPTVPDESTYEMAWNVLNRYDLWAKVPASIREHLDAGRRGKIPETPKPGDPIFERVTNVIIGDNAMAAEAALKKAHDLGYNAMLLSTFIEGEARQVARVFAGIAREIATHGRPVAVPACIIAGGETTVTLQGTGKGGRNMELALAAALAIDGLDNALIAALATDGTDGPTDAAGAIADGTTVARAQAQGLDPRDYLRRSDSYNFFDQLGDLIITGPTNTNVNDLIFVFVFK